MRTFATIRKLLVIAALVAAPLASFAGIFISVGFAPPALPVYTQPLCPGDGYLWNPGYWAYGPGGYYWVPGVWVQPPTVGYLWTPPYWGFAGGVYGFHEGYWGPHVGFYGGVNYGFGFFGAGFAGGRWEGGHFAYNTAVNNINVTNIHNTYVDRTVINNVNVSNHTSFNGGPGGLQARPNAQEAAYDHENHVPPTAVQQSHFQAAQQNRANFASANGGHPQMAAIQRPGSTAGAVPARGAVAARAGNQQQRIAQGVGSGQITARGASNLENREANINQTARQDRQANGGALNQQQRQNLNQRQNNVSNSIYNDKHNAATQPGVRPATPQPRAQAAQPHPQPAPRAEGHEGGGGPRTQAVTVHRTGKEDWRSMPVLFLGSKGPSPGASASLPGRAKCINMQHYA